MKTLYAAFLSGGELYAVFQHKDNCYQHCTKDKPPTACHNIGTHVDSELVDFAIIRMENVPDELAERLLKQGTPEQAFRDGFQAARFAFDSLIHYHYFKEDTPQGFLDLPEWEQRIKAAEAETFHKTNGFKWEITK